MHYSCSSIKRNFDSASSAHTLLTIFSVLNNREIARSEYTSTFKYDIRIQATYVLSGSEQSLKNVSWNFEAAGAAFSHTTDGVLNHGRLSPG